MSEKSDQRDAGRLQTPHDESNRTGDDASPTQHDSAQKNAAEEDRTGPGHPPRNSRWKKGGPSPNPKGRPRKEQTMLPDLKQALEQAFNKKVRVSRGDKKVLMTRIDIGLEQLLNQVAKGDRHAWRVLMDIAAKAGIDFQARHKQILEEALAPLSGANVTSTPAVLAPPELLDGDRAETAAPAPSRPKATAAPGASAPAPANPAPTATSATPPLAKTKPASTSVSAPPRENVPAAPLATATTPKPAVFSTTPSPANNERAIVRAARPQSTIGPTPPPQSETKTAAALEPTTPAKATSTPELEPPLKPGVPYPKPFKEMTPHAKWVWFPEWCAEHPEICSQRAVFPGDKR
jgi:Family of unknown function (DUF5681)